jgi:hypothetical protein
MNPDPARKSAAAKWNPERWQSRCAWCERKLSATGDVFGITISLRPEALRELEPGTIQPLLLGPSGKVAPMIIIAGDSPAKKAGKDAAFQICSEKCGQALQAALQAALRELPGQD